MEELLTKLYEKLGETFKGELKAKDIHYFEDSKSIDVFKTLMFLKKNNNDLNKIMIKGSISKDELEHFYGKDIFNHCINKEFVIRGNLLNNDKIFIGANGLFKLYSIKEYNFQDVFIAFDSNNFKLGKRLTLKSQEKIWCIFLLLFGADKKESPFNTEGLSHKELGDYHKFLKSIEKEVIKNNLDLGGKIGWDTGKDSVFRKFITNNVDLPKTSLYFKGNKHQFYLDISKRKNAKHLLNLILDNYSGEQRLLANDMFYDTLNELSFKISMDLGEMPGTINKYIIEELKN